MERFVKLLRLVDWASKSGLGRPGVSDMTNNGAIVYNGLWNFTRGDGREDICGTDFESSN